MEWVEPLAEKTAGGAKVSRHRYGNFGALTHNRQGEPVAIKMVTPGRLELPALGLGNRCSIRLSYGVAGAMHTAWNAKGQDAGGAAPLLGLGQILGHAGAATLAAGTFP